MKSEDSSPKDKLLDGEMRGKDKQRTGYREVRQYHTDFYFLQSLWPDEDKEQRLLPKRQAVGWRNERKGQTEDRLQRSQTISHKLLFLSLYDQMKKKSRDSCPKDKLLDGGMRGKDKKSTCRLQRSQTISHILLFLSLPPWPDVTTPTWNPPSQSKPEGNQKSGKSISVAKINERGKPVNDCPA